MILLLIEILNKEFWEEFIKKALTWAVTEIPLILITTLIFVFALKFFNKLTTKLQPFLLNRKYIEKSLNPIEAQKRINTLVNLSYGAIKVFLWAVYFIIILSKLGIQIAPLIASAGIVGLAIGFGSQELIRDVISGFFILLENQVRVGDIAILNGTGGVVEKIELRTISLRDFSGTVHIFQNGKINTLSNTTKDWSAAVFEIGVAYKENVNRVIDFMIAVSDEMRKDELFSTKIIEDIEIAGLDRFENSAVVIKARLKTVAGEQWAVLREYHKRLKALFDKENIEIPFPHTTVYFAEKSAALNINIDKENLNG